MFDKEYPELDLFQQTGVINDPVALLAEIDRAQKEVREPFTTALEQIRKYVMEYIARASIRIHPNHARRIAAKWGAAGSALQDFGITGRLARDRAIADLEKLLANDGLNHREVTELRQLMVYIKGSL